MENEAFWRAVVDARAVAAEGARTFAKIIDGTREKVKNDIEDAAARDYDAYCRSADALRQKLNGFVPEVLMILGSGLGFLAERVENPVIVDYDDIPYFKTSTAPGHMGRFLFGSFSGKNVAIMQGRMHSYEGYSMASVTYALRVAHLLGADKLVVTNAAGAVNTDFQAGDIMLITDHIKLAGNSPLTGKNIPQFGERFPDMSHAYTPRLQQVARDVAAEQGMVLREGVYMFMPGPQFETPAEIRAIRVLGGDAVGMSSVPEVIAAAHCGMEVLGFSLCANMAAGILDQPLSEKEVLDAAEAAKGKFSALVCGCVEKM